MVTGRSPEPINTGNCVTLYNLGVLVDHAARSAPGSGEVHPSYTVRPLPIIPPRPTLARMQAAACPAVSAPAVTFCIFFDLHAEQGPGVRSHRFGMIGLDLLAGLLAPRLLGCAGMGRQ